MNEILLGSLVFTGLVTLLALIVMGARAVLRPQGIVRLTINGEGAIEGDLGEKLISALDNGGVHLPTSCGRVGTCGLCKVQVLGTATKDNVLPIERTKLSDEEIADGFRLACQTVLRSDLEISIPPEFLSTNSWQCSVAKTRTLSPLIKEIVLDLPNGESCTFPAGCYVMVDAPSFTKPFSEISVQPIHEAAWERFGLRKIVAENTSLQSRAYSLVNRPDDKNRLILNIRLALAPGSNPHAPPGVVSSYLFGLEQGDTVQVSGPYGNFFVQDTSREIIFIGGGVGMAPIYAHVHSLLESQKSKRTISYWYGARGLIDLYYADEMETLANVHKNFSWHVALSDPAPDDAWEGGRGYIHDVLFQKYLNDHPDPKNCEYYLCGPPLMIKAVRTMLDRLDVPREHIFYDDFGD
ncbi:MAG: NADH:ubiquinone reductase (Na(+)-transporting) subunit F [Rhodospirillaceae bacterium]|nr:NADH:ubiquinone reductase (Na(+)-transporting) subunit F [Rhodospirillaceae bacterium]